jgi:hypothetical protein
MKKNESKNQEREKERFDNYRSSYYPNSEGPDTNLMGKVLSHSLKMRKFQGFYYILR